MASPQGGHFLLLSMKIVCLGEAVLDKVYILKEEFKNGVKVLAKRFYYEIGGSALRAGLVLKKLGFEVNFITSLGKDKEGEVVLRELKKKGIKVVVYFRGETKENIVIINNNERTIIKKPVKKQYLQIKDPKLIKEAKLIILDRHHLEAFNYIWKNKKEETEIIFDPSTEISSRTIKILRKVNYPILPWEALKIFSSNFKRALFQIKTLLKKPFILTCGKYGAIFVDKKIKLFNSYKTKIFNPNGAGDVFRGAFGYGLLKNLELEKNIDFANYLSAVYLRNNLNFPKIFLQKKLLRKNKFIFQDLVENFKNI